MYVTLVHVHVREKHVAEFINATRVNHGQSVMESGNLRFDLLQLPEDSTRFIIYEAYLTESDAAGHKQTRHYEKWRDTVAPWMASPRRGIVYKGLLPETGP